MARFSSNGIEAISASFAQLAQLTDEDKKSILRPAADLLIEAYKSAIASLFTQHTGALGLSIKAKEATGEEGPVFLIYPQGSHPESGTGQRKSRKQGEKKKKKTAAEVGYILEFGSPRHKPRYWMQTVNEQQADAIAEAEAAAWDELVTQKGL